MGESKFYPGQSEFYPGQAQVGPGVATPLISIIAKKLHFQKYTHTHTHTHTQVDTIDPCAGVTVLEGGRVVQGPKSPQKSYRHIVPQRPMLPVQPNRSSTILSSEVG